ncbi:MAG: SRPBCC domain-containing protein [Phycisphaerales bacterium JB059]
MTDEKPGTRSVTSRIDIEATPEQVWAMLATGEGMQRWFPIEARVTPGEGGELWFSWGKGVMEGAAKIVVWDPPRRLVGEWGGMHDEYLLEGRGGVTTLTVVSSGFGEGSDWDEMLDSVRTGWAFELRGLKHAMEAHAGEDRTVLRSVRRCAPDREGLSAVVHDHALAPGTDLRRASEGDEVTLRLDGLGEVKGRVAVANGPRDMAIITPELNEAYWRVLIEPPCAGSAEPAMDVTLWASTYGLDSARRDELGRAIDRTLARLLGERGERVEV